MGNSDGLNEWGIRPQKMALESRLQQDREDKRHTDVTIKCGSTSLAAHKVVLATASNVFERMLYGQFKEAKTGELNLSSERLELVQAMIDFMYQHRYSVKGLKDHIGVYILADQYNVEGLIEWSVEALKWVFFKGLDMTWTKAPDELPNWTVSDLEEVVRYLWDEANPTHIALRRCIMQVIWQHKKLLLRHQIFRSLIKDGGDFVFEYIEGFKQPAKTVKDPPESEDSNALEEVQW